MRILTTSHSGWFLAWCLCASTATAVEPVQESGVGGLRFRTSRAGEVWQRELDRAGFTPEAIPRLQLLLEQARDQFLNGSEVNVTGGHLVEDWLQNAPQEQWDRWDKSTRNAAQDVWKRWEETRDEAVLRDFLQSYGVSRQGLIGWKNFAHQAMDDARWELAAAGLEHVRRHRAATAADRAQALVELIAVRLRQDRRHEAAHVAATQADDLHGQTVRWGGVVQPVADVLRDLIPQAPIAVVSTTSRPGLQMDWKHPIPLPEELRTYWPEWRRDYRAEGVWLNPIAEPVIVGDSVIVQTIAGLEARPLQEGRGKPWRVRHDDWRRMLEQAEKWGSREWRGQVLDQLVRRESADSILGRITTDGHRVFTITGGTGSELDRLIPGKNNAATPREDATTHGHIENRLTAYDVKTGELVWQAGGPSAGPTYRFAHMFFCGPPCVVDNTLYVVAQQDTELQLVALDAATGEGFWSTVLGDVPRSLASDPTRQRTACPIVWDNGLLITTTVNGSVIAVDALTHAPRWAYRYPTTPRDMVLRSREQNTNFQPDPWWDAWREARVQAIGDAIIFVSPESQRVHVIDRRTGRPRWSVPRGNALWLTGVDAQHVTVAGPHHVAAYHLADGKPAWQTNIPESGGRPLMLATEILQPLANRHVAHIRLSDGSLQLVRGVDNPVVGNLVTDGQHWVSISSDDLIRWRDDVAGSVLTKVEPRSEAARQAALATLAEHPEAWRNHVQDLPEGGFTDESFELAEALIAAARQQGQLVEAGRLILSWLALPAQNETVLTTGVRRHVRVDLACLGFWDDVWQQADASQRVALSALLEEQWQRAERGSDPFALARLLELLHPLAIAREKAQRVDDRHFLGRSFAAVELQLLSLAASAQGAEASRLWQRLAREQARSGFARAAQDSLGQARRRSSETPIDPMLKVSVPARTGWPANSPLIESQPERNYDVHQSAIPLDLDSSAFFDDLDVGIDRQYRKVYFHSRDQRRTWDLPLTKSSSNMRFIPHLLMGWGRGRVLVLRVGSELFAIAPFDEHDEPVARILWTVDLLAGSMVLAEHVRPENLPVIPGVREEDFRVLNAFGRTLGQVGPVRAGFLCFQEKGKLVSVETFTGRKRWERYDLPFDARTFGDEDHVFVWSPSRQSIEVLRAMDGKLIASRAWDAHPDRMVLLQDSRAYRLYPHEIEWELRCEEMVTGQALWTHTVPPGASPVVLDREIIGIAEPAGRLRFLTLRDGWEFAEPVTFAAMPQLERALVSRDADTWYVAVSNKVSRQGAVQPANNRNSHRTPLVDGPLIAIDRQTFRPRWQTTLTRTPWLIDQSRTAPLLLHAYKFGTPDQIANGLTNGIIRLLDKRTGAEVLQREGTNVLGFATFQSDPDRGLVEVRFEQETLRLRYYPHPPAPTSPEP